MYNCALREASTCSGLARAASGIFNRAQLNDVLILIRKRFKDHAGFSMAGTHARTYSPGDAS